MLPNEEGKEASGHVQKGNFVRRWWIAIVICICVVAGLRPAFLVLRRSLLLGQYDDMVGALHKGMSSTDVVNALGRPCKRFEAGNQWAYLLYQKSGTNMGLVIGMRGWYQEGGILNERGVTSLRVDSTTINDWAVLVPYPADGKSVCSVGPSCKLTTRFDKHGLRIRNISCPVGLHYEVVKQAEDAF